MANKEQIAYGKGFRDGFLRGQEAGLRFAATIMNTRPGQKVKVTCDSEESKMIVEAFRNLKK